MSAIILLVLRIFLAGVLYLFAGWAIWTIWRDLKHQSLLLSVHQLPTLTLLASIDGLDQSLSFTTPLITIGRDPGCDYVLEETTVSAIHARLNYRQSQWWLEDLHSTNGTFLNQEAVVDPVVVTTGDQIYCGQVLVKIKIGDRPAHG